ncbi:hypothetical protein [Arthrobacter sp. B3I4]|uniref:hypothetical protein n=1 Tax=Arthrobacter sp. B3I4 TaxID=3042267 RepID=UPI0027816ED5|nr:hypothetical protein [Arthrobacter sp. B3I4]MDQ0756104.1 hypothetical protein [Arthrobacter sp. B3I4]
MSIWNHDLPRLTEKQRAALELAARRVENMHGSHLGFWGIVYAEEVRPGRGHDITAWAADGEAIATQYLDPYGNGPLVFSQTELIHNDADEDHHDEDGNCECTGAKA